MDGLPQRLTQSASLLGLHCRFAYGSLQRRKLGVPSPSSRCPLPSGHLPVPASAKDALEAHWTPTGKRSETPALGNRDSRSTGESRKVEILWSRLAGTKKLEPLLLLLGRILASLFNFFPPQLIHSKEPPSASPTHRPGFITRNCLCRGFGP